MTFLAPAALLGVLLLAIPIVVHLFKPRKMRQTPFSSLRWLKQTHQRLSRRIQWHQWLLFLLRAGCIIGLVFAIAKPLIGLTGSAIPTDRIVILDTSRSMAYQVADAATPMERGIELAAAYAEAARPGDRTAVILAGAPPRLLAPLGADASAHVPAVRAAKATLADTSLTTSLPLVRAVMERTSDRQTELIFLTDNRSNRWQPGDIQTLIKDAPANLKVKVVDVGAGAGFNAWIAGARLASFGAGEDRWIRAEIGCVQESSTPRQVRLTGIDGIPEQAQVVPLRAGQLARVDFKIPPGVNLKGQVAQLRLDPGDSLASDDSFFLNLDTAWSLRVLVIDPDAPGEDGRPVGLHLRVAMESLAATRNQALDVHTRTATAANARDIAKADVVFLASIPKLTDAALTALEERVRGGGGLAIFLGPHARTAFYNEKLHRPQQPAEGLLPFTFRAAVPGRPGRLTNVQWANPLLAALNDPPAGDLLAARFHYFGSLEGAPVRRDAVLARFDDDVPAIIERPLGAGRVLVFNTTANDEWSDLVQRKSFVPLMDRMLTCLSAAGVKRSYTAGDPVVLPLVEPGTQAEATVVSPAGVKGEPRLQMLGGRAMLHVDDVAEAGAYRVQIGANQPLVFAVNAARADSPLGAMDAAALESWWAPTPLEILTPDAARQQLQAASGGWPAWPALIVLAGLLLLAETIYVHRLCPRANPKAAEAVVPERGMMKPVAERAG